VDRRDELRKKILELAALYCRETHGPKEFREGERIPYGGRVFDADEVTELVDASLDFWLTAGKRTETFERDFAGFIGVKHCVFVNSGSSANLLAFMALTSPMLGNRRIEKEDEVITVAAGFPTTVAPVIQYGAVPVFIDVSLPTYNADISRLEEALSGRTKAVFFAHTLGNPFDVRAVKDFCSRRGLWLIEDNCDALGSQYFLNGGWARTGTFGHMATSSFYPPHHMTTGEGGAVCTDDQMLHKILLSLRDWGRDCSCPSGVDDSCGCRFSGQFGELPRGYDHKYVYSHFGYNLKATDLQAAVGIAQLRKLPGFIETRRRNWDFFRQNLESLSDFFVLPEAEPNSEPSWFGFPLTVREEAPFSRDGAVAFLESRGIQTRMLFAGNLVKHPCFDGMRREGKGYRIAGSLTVTDKIMNSTFWIGVYPGLDGKRLEYMTGTLSRLRDEA